jgi:hypothetical protein
MRTRNLTIFAVVVATLATLTAAGSVFAAAANVLNVSVNHGPSGAGIDSLTVMPRYAYPARIPASGSEAC